MTLSLFIPIGGHIMIHLCLPVFTLTFYVLLIDAKMLPYNLLHLNNAWPAFPI